MDNEDWNVDNIIQGNFDNIQIKNNNIMFTQLDASLMPAMDISVGTQYTGALDNIMKKEYNDVRKTAQDHLVSGNENRNIILENIKTDIETHVNDIKEKRMIWL